jgi:hypothetical protein
MYATTIPEQMRFKDFLEDFQAYEKLKADSKPKEEKKKEPLGPWDYITFILFVNAITVPVGACIIMAYATEFIRAISHP